MRFTAAALALVLLGTAPSAQGPRPMSFEDVMAVKAVTDPQVSPDGRWVAYVVATADMKENVRNADIWLVAAEGGTPLRLTTSPKNDTQPRWSPDGKWLAFVSARDEKPQVFIISPFGGEAERLTQSKAGVQAFQWSPDGKRLAYVAEDDPTSEDEKKQKDKDDVQLVDQQHKFGRIWVIERESGSSTKVVSGEFHASDPQWSPDGQSLAYVVAPSPKADDGTLTDVWVARADGSQARRLVENTGPDTAPRWSPDGSQIALLSRAGAKGLLGHLRIAVVPAAGGAMRDIATDFFYQAETPVWSGDGKTIYFAAQTRLRQQLWSVPAGGGRATAVSSTDGTLAAFSIARSADTAAFVVTSSTRVPDVFVSRLAPFTPRKLTDHQQVLAGVALARSETVTWTSKDGLEVEGVLFYPVGYEPGRKYPLLVNVHGGPSGVWADAFPASWANFGHVWAGKGWLVFYPNPRGSSGYGEKFLLANVRDWGGGDYQDIQTGIDALIARGLADADRMGQTGWSYGGYMTAWTLTQTRRFKALMVGAGLTNMFSMYSTNDLQRTLEGYFGAEPWDDTEIYYTRSAMNFIKQARTPTLVMHGGADLRVPLGQAQELYMGLKKNDVPVEMAVYPREPHGLQEPRHQLDKMQREYAWFEKHVMGEQRGTRNEER